MPTRRHIRLTWVASGESVVAELLDDEAPQVCALIWGMLPVEQKSIHGQFSGAEVFVLLDMPQPSPRHPDATILSGVGEAPSKDASGNPPQENLCQLPLPGELLYFFDPGGNVTSGTRQAAEICVIYNRGIVLRGPEGAPTHASLFARIPGDWKYDWKDFAAACRRVRHEGPQRLRIERVT